MYLAGLIIVYLEGGLKCLIPTCLEIMLALKSEKKRKKDSGTADGFWLSCIWRGVTRNSLLLLSFPCVVVIFNWEK